MCFNECGFFTDDIGPNLLEDDKRLQVENEVARWLGLNGSMSSRDTSGNLLLLTTAPFQERSLFLFLPLHSHSMLG